MSFPRIDPSRDQKSHWMTFEKLGPGDQTSRHTPPDHLVAVFQKQSSGIGSNLGNGFFKAKEGFRTKIM